MALSIIKTDIHLHEKERELPLKSLRTHVIFKQNPYVLVKRFEQQEHLMKPFPSSGTIIKSYANRIEENQLIVALAMESERQLNLLFQRPNDNT